jgi:hypothetical protein
VVDAFDLPRLTYNVDKKYFEAVKSKPKEPSWEAVFPTTTLPPLILPSRVCNIVFRDAPFPSSNGKELAEA